MNISAPRVQSLIFSFFSLVKKVVRQGIERRHLAQFFVEKSGYRDNFRLISSHYNPQWLLTVLFENIGATNSIMLRPFLEGRFKILGLEFSRPRSLRLFFSIIS